MIVTGLTADRMKAIEAASVIKGAIVGDELILTRQDGSTIDAGNVRGPKGDTGNNVDAKAYSDAGDATTLASAKTYSDGLWGGTELAGGIDLNTITAPGVYLQSQSAEAVSGVNYPVPSSGYLEVRATPGRGNVWQEYVALNAPDRLYKRAYFSSTGWTAWKTYVSVPDDDVAWATQTLASGFTVPSGYTPRARKKGGFIYLDGYVYGNFTGAGGGAYVTAFTLPSWAWPLRPLGFSAMANTTAVMTVSVQTNGQVQVWASASNGAWLSFSNCSWPNN